MYKKLIVSFGFSLFSSLYAVWKLSPCQVNIANFLTVTFFMGIIYFFLLTLVEKLFLKKKDGDKNSEDGAWRLRFWKDENGLNVKRFIQLDEGEKKLIAQKFPYFLGITAIISSEKAEVSATISKMEDRIEARFCGENKGIKVFINTWDDKKEFCLYIKEIGDAKACVEEIAREFPDYFPNIDIQFLYKHDPEWLFYSNMTA